VRDGVGTEPAAETVNNLSVDVNVVHRLRHDGRLQHHKHRHVTALRASFYQWPSRVS